MGIIHAIIGCALGAATFWVLTKIGLNIATWGIWSTAFLVALCLIWTFAIGYAPQWWATRFPAKTAP
jgi:hypothetical protein